MVTKRRKNHVRFRSTVFGEYMMDQYFFKVATHERKLVKLEDLDLRKLQHDHIVTIVHEYLHHLHEVSTHIGTFFLSYAVSIRAILSRYADKDLSTSDFNFSNISLEDATMILRLSETINLLIGDAALEIEVKNILDYDVVESTIFVPYGTTLVEREHGTPELRIANGDEILTLQFGKFYLYEGLAYELERVFAQTIGRKHDDEENGTEYTVLRYFSMHIVPSITRKTMLTLASLSLAYVNCGVMYVSMLERLAIELREGRSEADLIRMVKANVSQEYAEREHILEGVLKEIEDAFKLRSSLKIALADLKENYINAGRQRVINPSFEVDMIYNGQFEDLLYLVPPCDFMYVFTNKATFKRDFYGTTKTSAELAINHNIFIANVHYANALFFKLSGEFDKFKPGDNELTCPFFTSCDFQFRKDNPSICSGSPWKIYDIAFAEGKGYCWYGNGVGLLKGIDIPPDDQPA